MDSQTFLRSSTQFPIVDVSSCLKLHTCWADSQSGGNGNVAVALNRVQQSEVQARKEKRVTKHARNQALYFGGSSCRVAR